jgi:arylsulfatase A-like enzyme
VVGYKSPHGPRTPPPRAAKRFAGETARPAPNMDAKPPYKAAGARPGAANAQWGDAQLNYFRTVSAVDDNLGRLLDALDELKIAGHTLVVFASDNGYYLGEHTLGDKRSAYDESIRIPLLVRFPKGAASGKAIDEMALNIDLAPTLLDYAGVEVPREMQGRSLRPLLEGKPPREPWRKAFFYEYFWERRFDIPTTLAVRTPDAKLIRYPGHDDWTELYDLRSDPYETKNLARDPPHGGLLKRMQDEFDRQAKQVDFKVPDYAHERMPAPATRGRRGR